MKWSEVQWSAMKWSEVKWSGVTWRNVKWSEVKWSEVKWSEVKWSEVKWSKLKPRDCEKLTAKKLLCQMIFVGERVRHKPWPIFDKMVDDLFTHLYAVTSSQTAWECFSKPRDVSLTEKFVRTTLYDIRGSRKKIAPTQPFRSERETGGVLEIGHRSWANL